MNHGHCEAVVLCISRSGAVSQDALCLSEADLQTLFVGGKLEYPDQGYVLQGITKAQINGANYYRNFQLIPPAHVQAWGMSSVHGETHLWFPKDPQTQQALVRISYDFDVSNDELFIQLEQAEGYRDGDLMYQVPGHLPIPVPGQYLNAYLPMRPGADVKVLPSPEAIDKYVLKRSR
jgi:hypothetical protein